MKLDWSCIEKGRVLKKILAIQNKKDYNIYALAGDLII